MAFRVACSDLGIENCDWIATGETAGDVVEQAVHHLRQENHINLPDAKDIVAGDFSQGVLDDTMDPAVTTIIRRLREKLDLQGTATTTGPDLGLASGRVKSP